MHLVSIPRKAALAASIGLATIVTGAGPQAAPHLLSSRQPLVPSVAYAAAQSILPVMDPLTFLEQTLSAGDLQTSDQYGYSVAIDRDTAIVGARHHTWTAGTRAGAAYVYVRSGAGWALQAKLTASDATAEDSFGFSVAIDGDTAVVGAQGASAAYVFARSGATWSEQGRLSAAANSSFGYSVAISGETVVVSATNTSSAHVFVRSAGAWAAQGTLLGTDVVRFDEFGWSVAIAGDTVLVGAPYDDTVIGTDSGAVFVFTRSGTDWTEAGTLVPSDASGDHFGSSVAIDGDRAVVGATQGDGFVVFENGAAYVYERVADVWHERAKLIASDAAKDDRFGGSVAISGDRIVVGAHNDRNASGEVVGAAYVFDLNAGGVWDERAKLTASDGAVNDSFATTVAVSSDILLVGAASQEDAHGRSTGLTYSYIEQTTADLLVGVGQDRLNVKQGEEFTYIITVANNGSSRALNTIVHDTLPSGAVFSSASARRGQVYAPAVGQTGTVTWHLGDVLSGTTESAQLVVKVIARGKASLTNTVTVASDTADPDLANNTASITTTVASGGGKK